MDLISWQEIARRLLFAFILGSAVGIEKSHYQTRHFILSTIQMTLGTAMFSILASLTSETKFSSQLILGVSIICAGFFWQKSQKLVPVQNLNAITKLWCAGAAGALVGYGLFVPAYISILIILVANFLLPALEKNFIPDIEQELDSDSKPSKEIKLTTKATPPEVHYQCRVNCLAADEATVLALLVQLGKEQKLILTKVSSKDLVNHKNNKTLLEIEIQVDFISQIRNSPLQLQQMLISLKSKSAVSSASWLNLSPELDSMSNMN